MSCTKAIEQAIRDETAAVDHQPVAGQISSPMSLEPKSRNATPLGRKQLSTIGLQGQFRAIAVQLALEPFSRVMCLGLQENSARAKNLTDLRKPHGFGRFWLQLANNAKKIAFLLPAALALSGPPPQCPA